MTAREAMGDADRELAMRQYALSCALSVNERTNKDTVTQAREFYDFLSGTNERERYKLWLGSTYGKTMNDGRPVTPGLVP